MIFSPLPSSSGCFSFSASNRAEDGAEVTPPPPSQEKKTHPISPRCVLLICDDCVFSSKGPSLALPLSLSAPRFCCSNVLSAPHIAAEPPKLRTDTLFPNLRPPGCGDSRQEHRGRKPHLKKKNEGKRKGRKKENVTTMRKKKSLEIYPRFLQAKKKRRKKAATPAVRLGCRSLHTACDCDAHTLSDKHTFIGVYSSRIRAG